MALETLKGVEKIGGFEVGHAEKAWEDEDGNSGMEDIANFNNKFVTVNHSTNQIGFRIQDGPIKENGINGCQVDTLIEAAKLIIDGLDLKFPCIENKMASHGLQAALWALESRKANREARGVEGTSNG